MASLETSDKRPTIHAANRQSIHVLESNDGTVSAFSALCVADCAYILARNPIHYNRSAGRSLCSAISVARIPSTDVFEVVSKQVMVKVYSKRVEANGALAEFSTWLLLASLDRTDILTPIDRLYEDADNFFAFLPGFINGDLFDRFADRGLRFNEDEAKTFARWLFRLLVELRSTVNLAHRDISLENILCGNKEGEFVLIDFDSAKVAHDGLIPVQFVGKDLYRAPELYTATMYDPFLADVWSAGVCVFILLTLQPFVGMASELDPYYRCLAAGRYKESVGDIGISDECYDFFMEVMQPDPSKRPFAEQVLSHAWLK